MFMLPFSGLDMFIITPFTPDGNGMINANAVYGPATFTGVLGIILFRQLLSEKKRIQIKTTMRMKTSL